MNFVRRHLPILLILVLASLTHFYRLPATITFLEDEGRDLLMVKRMLDTGRPVLLGPQTSTGNMYLGPLYYYLITPALVLSRMDPLGPAAFIALSAVVTTYLLYLFGRRFLSPLAGYLAALMYAVFPLPVFFTRNSWNPNLVPLVSLVVAWVVIELTGNSRKLWHYFVLGALFAALLQLHYMSLVFIAAAALIVGVANLRRPRQLGLGIVLALTGFVIVLSPFLLFELRNHWVNTQALLRFAGGEEGQAIRYSLPLWLARDKLVLISTKLFSALFGRGGQRLDPHATLITVVGLMTILAAAIRAWLTRAKQGSRAYLRLTLLFALPFLALAIYQENIHLHYLGFFFPVLYLLLSGSASLGRPWRSLAIFLISVSLVYSLPTTYNYLQSGATKQVVRAREVAAYISQAAGSDSYNVVSQQDYFTTPFQYFLALSSHPPTNQLAQRIFIICPDKPCRQDEETTVLLFLTGPAHPSLAAYLGHPQLNSFNLPRRMVTNEHVSHGLWVGELVLENSVRP